MSLGVYRVFLYRDIAEKVVIQKWFSKWKTKLGNHLLNPSLKLDKTPNIQL